MTRSPDVCPEGWEADQLLAYIEGHLEPDAERDLARHLPECRVCTQELESLRRLDSLLKKYPETFHPDEEELYRFASEQTDPEGRIARHLETCLECGESLRVFREMMHLRAADPERSKMPQAVEREIERIYGKEFRPAKRRLIGVLSDFLRKTFSVPVLALGTAAAVLILGVLIIPMWTALKEVRTPAAVPPAEKTQVGQTEQRFNVDGRISSQESRDDGRAKKVYPKDGDLEAPSLPQSAAPAAVPEQTAPEPKPSLKAAPQKPVRGLGEKRKMEFQGYREAPRAERPAAGATPGRESELNALPKTRSPAPAAAKPTRQSELKEEEGLPAPERFPGSLAPPLSAKKADTRIPVRVLITDFQGKPVPWLSFVPDPAINNRYIFVRQATTKDELSRQERRAQLSARTEEAPEGYTITLQVTESAGMYAIEAKLFPEGQEGESAPSKRIVARNLKKDDVSAKVTSLVGLLLGH